MENKKFKTSGRIDKKTAQFIRQVFKNRAKAVLELFEMRLAKREVYYTKDFGVYEIRNVQVIGYGKEENRQAKET